MKWIKRFENYKEEPLSESDIMLGCDMLYHTLWTLGITMTHYSQKYGENNPKGIRSGEREIISIEDNLNFAENSILNIILNGIIPRKPFTDVIIPQQSKIDIIILNEYPSAHSKELIGDDPNKSNIINPQTVDEIYTQAIEKLILFYNNYSNKLKVSGPTSASAVSDIYDKPIIKKIIVDYLMASLIKKEIPESIIELVAAHIKDVENPYETLTYLKENEPNVYNRIIKYKPTDFDNGEKMGEMGF